MGEPAPAPRGWGAPARSALSGSTPAEREPLRYLERTLDIYYEFPPVRRTQTTRWGDAWSDETYPTQAPLFEDGADDDIFYAEAPAYTWLCYARLRSR